jgi:phosphate transport system permease protein
MAPTARAGQELIAAGARPTSPSCRSSSPLQARVNEIRAVDRRYRVTLEEVNGRTVDTELSQIVRFYRQTIAGIVESIGIYLSRWWEFVSTEPREANTQGGVLPAIFGTVAMTLLMVVFVAPFGVITALYLREYAKQGRLTSIVRISVNNLAGVPSIVYGVFGLGFFAYTMGGSIDQLFYPESLPNPTFGKGGILWASLTLALLTVPVVIVASEEALAAVPRSMREGSLACGASKWQTIRYVVLPKALPGIMTGMILAMARGAGEVAPLMLVGVVKLAPALPIDTFYPFFHLDRSFMHLGFHIFDVGFQSRNSEAGKPMVFVTTLLLLALIVTMNATAITIRNRLKKKYAGGQF